MNCWQAGHKLSKKTSIFLFSAAWTERMVRQAITKANLKEDIINKLLDRVFKLESDIKIKNNSVKHNFVVREFNWSYFGNLHYIHLINTSFRLHRKSNKQLENNLSEGFKKKSLRRQYKSLIKPVKKALNILRFIVKISQQRISGFFFLYLKADIEVNNQK